MSHEFRVRVSVSVPSEPLLLVQFVLFSFLTSAVRAYFCSLFLALRQLDGGHPRKLSFLTPAVRICCGNLFLVLRQMDIGRWRNCRRQRAEERRWVPTLGRVGF